MTKVEERLKERVLETTDKALDIVDRYMKDKGGEEDPKVTMAFKLLNQGIKILHMNQVKTLTERSQALRLLKWLPDDAAREEYIKITNPQAVPLLLKRPK